ncbi:hypothetical protein EMCG_00142 [[Emmonsia] crescens]|uniref:Uncharacterized protein n=1 Tax=[Emmonsia] crescens TaxID=73230 RepID=A0A0G2HUS1_9EURO|nr:hypothetical protein EMCG_00142 [Emmonsia crescens UAMH 3008]
MTGRSSGSYDGEVEEASVSIGGKQIDSETARQLSSSAQAAKDKRAENKAAKALDAVDARLEEEENKENKKTEKKGESSK